MEYITLKLNNIVDERQKSQEKRNVRRSSKVDFQGSRKASPEISNFDLESKQNDYKDHKLQGVNNTKQLDTYGQKKLINKEKVKQRLNMDVDFKNLPKDEVDKIKKKLKRIWKRERIKRKKKKINESECNL